VSTRAIVLAAGMGTRMKSALPKVLHPICGRPMLWYTLRALADAGVDEIVVVTNPQVDEAIATLARDFAARTVVQDPQRGTGHAVQVALAALTPAAGTIVVAYGDMPLVTPALFERVLGAVDAEADTVLALVTARMPLPSNFGRIVRSSIGSGQAEVAKIVEARDCTPAERAIDEMNAGIYAFDEARLRAVIGNLSDANAQRELYLTDTVELLIASGGRVVPVVADDYRAVLGVNDRVELANARAVLNRTLCEAHMRSGVTIVDPAATYLEPDLVIAQDVVIYPNTTLGGATSVGTGSEIGPNTRLHGARVGASCAIRESVVVDARIGDRVRVGPFAHIRGGSIVEDHVHIGNFVELKQTTMHADAKAGHLAYLGDGIIGARANIGAGTIFCNYDGKNKSTTTIGADAFIGSNSSLVAPVSVGAGALTGAGTVVIRDVGPGERVVGNPGRRLEATNVPLAAPVPATAERVHPPQE
jgi:bifunctional UDP-N-acetylglucosamine pyrophosphorylase/glucosamine-1-phosphate N-acetyltransferase